MLTDRYQIISSSKTDRILLTAKTLKEAKRLYHSVAKRKTKTIMLVDTETFEVLKEK